MAVPSTKRICAENSIQCNTDGDVKTFTLDSLPPQCYHLGGEHFVVVSDFANVVRVHLRQYKPNTAGEFAPTKYGVTLTPFLWQAFSQDMDNMHDFNPPSAAGLFSAVRDALLLSTVNIEDELCITLQRFFLRKDFSRQFIPTVCVLRSAQWERLKVVRDYITADVISLMFGRSFRFHMLNESTRWMPGQSAVEPADVEMGLTTCMVELLHNKLVQSIDELFVCDGCTRNLENQLGHGCIYMQPVDKLNMYYELALCKIDIKNFVIEFVKQNRNVVNCITTKFVNSLDVKALLENVKYMYVQ